ncbi:Crp/Fnr family transcriptional regulator [Phaeocystidibacter marisrubri]|uniref:Crp/Fnr family transcriptional regulator n=1 Tax=Phaeocystidibacter marisrubri TaxID=1577780 RepID=A0A6L3ZHR0_9FLAO|nr:Crp/Fnr family transcriptional regulator [Phaeocystidibacter marisrubri]KAB2817391.1 Crp/Fnr family transcriptional regulator [Phaeocystidibacter marisrubri]GGH75581.1 cAMP-binding protein [Phaeocystidibacter marisrubri]
MSQLIESITAVVDLAPEEQSKIEAAFHPHLLKKGDYFIQSGEVCNRIAFVEHGQIRVYYSDESGDETTCHFAGKHEFTSSLTSMLTRAPSKDNFVALENTKLLIIERDAMDQLCEDIPQLHIWRRVLVENIYIMMERRLSMMRNQSAQKRYETMIRENPDIILNVPLQYTASFLGITPQHLSRLRKQIS